MIFDLNYYFNKKSTKFKEVFVKTIIKCVLRDDIVNKKIVKEAVLKANYGLKLERKIVGVKFLFDEEEFINAKANKQNIQRFFEIVLCII
ncbi:hypothetical protein [Candidatus Contubernalis alkaliaceticus]|uniref:hypothetical protein n=1 Tax=Candidatus Contubernalis alkaliaceticus TaxID=338645 RepID=UPI001F4C16D4|nr:hypothetical protein [Candidatus Contubernalis alkalaceticus]UNC90840.1 hypothetical protein HUE98_01315 [Candidatus Contubernalis alkalaceticus]